MSQMIKMCVLIELVKDFQVQHNIYVLVIHIGFLCYNNYT
jgi:hypothetical protein